MTSNILELRKRTPYVCGSCGKPMKRRMPSNDPSFCCYNCALGGQEQYRKATLSFTRGEE